MLRFSSCTIDLSARVLTRTGQVEHLEPQAFDVLEFLLVNRDRVVSKEELLDSVWGGQWVSESALTTRVKEIRRATGDTGDTQTIVRTIRGRGYQLVADVKEDGPHPAPHHVLVGRDRDMDELDQRLQPGSLITLVGPGGVGKTSLGRTVVASAAPRFADGVAIVDLTVLKQSSQLVGAVARAARISDSSESNLIDAVSRLDALLLLDDADDMVPEVAQLCGQLSEHGGRISMVVTTRERLHVRGEQLWPVLPLSARAAQELLMARARQLAPFGSVLNSSGHELDSLTEAVDRLPLAVEMLASMSAFLSIAELLNLVGQQPHLVTSVQRDAPERHRSLDRLVEGSVERLDIRARRALTALTSFAGAFTVTDAAAIVGDEGREIDVLRELIDRSLLSSVTSAAIPRFQMLRTVRGAVVKDANPDEQDSAAQRHAEWVTTQLLLADERLRGEEEAEGAEVFERLADEARAAHAWARREDPPLAVQLTAALHLYAYSRLWAEPARWAEAISGEEREHGQVLATLASQAAQEGRLTEAHALAERLLDDNDVRVQGWALETLSDVAIYLGEFDDAAQNAQTLVDLGYRTSEPRMVAIGLTNTALANIYAGRAGIALQLLDGQAGQPAPAFAPSECAWLAFARGEALASSHESSAFAPLREAVRLGDSVGNKFVAGIARSTIASLETESGGFRAAAATYTDALDTFLRQGNVTHLRVFLRNTIPLMARLQEPATAAAVGSWVFGATAATGYGPDVEAARETLNRLRTEHGDEQMDAWEQEGLAYTATGAAERALAALRPHVGEE